MYTYFGCSRFEGEKPEDYIDEFYSISSYKKAYKPIINPTNGLNNWPKSNKPELQAPAKLKLPGHPKGKRRPELGEKGYMNSEEGFKGLIEPV